MVVFVPPVVVLHGRIFLAFACLVSRVCIVKRDNITRKDKLVDRLTGVHRAHLTAADPTHHMPGRTPKPPSESGRTPLN